MKALIIGLAFAAVLLSGCYASRILLLDPTDAAHPLDDGTYAREGGDQLHVSLEPDGWYRVEQIGAGGLIGESHRVLFNAITLAGGRPAFRRRRGFRRRLHLRRGLSRAGACLFGDT